MLPLNETAFEIEFKKQLIQQLKLLNNNIQILSKVINEGNSKNE